jgi:hypothetical protein
VAFAVRMATQQLVVVQFKCAIFKLNHPQKSFETGNDITTLKSLKKISLMRENCIMNLKNSSF